MGGEDTYHGIRTSRYKYVRHGTGEVEFYDMLIDPQEMSSLTDDPRYDTVQASLATELRRLQNCAGAECR